MNKHDKQHVRNLARIERMVEALFQAAATDAANLSTIIGKLGEAAFSWNDYPLALAKINEIITRLNTEMEAVIVNGVRAEWTLSNNKNNELCQRVFGSLAASLPESLSRRYYTTNESARDAFIARKEAGLGLSDRVWNYTNQFKGEIEMALDIGIRSGRSADELSRDVREYLKNPHKLFRRVRDEHGQLQLSKNAAAYHPGRGVYRSSYMNARRLAATETNIAYRTADYLRWQQLDFVVGVEIHLSNNHNCKGIPAGAYYDICDELKGKYPKDFQFTGWHPHCRCYATSILKTDEELAADNERILQGDVPTEGSVNMVTGVPTNFSQWVKDNADRIKGAKKQPYFIRDNKKKVYEIFNPSKLEVFVQKIGKNGVEYNEVKAFTNQISEEEIISRVGGGDLTRGSCASLAFAYAGNKCGFEVLDFRDGLSRQIFSDSRNLMEIAESVGGTIVKNTSDYVKAKELLKQVQESKEYYFTCGSHAAIVRKTGTGYEYLELQSATSNGFKPLTNDVLEYRFAAKKSHISYGTEYETKDCIIDIDLLRKDGAFRKLLGYINTQKDKQVKGVRGSMK